MQPHWLPVVAWAALGLGFGCTLGDIGGEWLLFGAFGTPPLAIDTSSHWFMMQVGMIAGFLTAWPANRRLLRSGVKERM